MAQEEQTLNTENGAEQPAPETQADPAAAPDAEAGDGGGGQQQRDVENARQFALERFVGALLPVIDNLERAQAAMGEPTDEIRPLLEGVQLTHRSFLDVMQKFEVAVVDPAGEVFNPELHQAMSMIESPDAAPNSVVAVMQKGYTLNGRLVRPAMVVVAKATSTPHIDTTA